MKTAVALIAALLALAACSSSGTTEMDDDGPLRQTAQFAAPAAGGREFFATILRFTVDTPDCGMASSRIRASVVEIRNSDGDRFEGTPGARPLISSELVNVDEGCAAEMVALGFVDQLTNRMEVVINSESFPITIEELLAGEDVDNPDNAHVIERAQ